MKNRKHFAGAVYLMPVNSSEQILIGRRAPHNYYMAGFWNLYAGHVELCELPSHALLREMQEEIEITFELEDLEHVHTSARPAHDETGNRIDLFYTLRRWSGTPRNSIADASHDDIMWCNPDRLPENTVPHVRECIQKILRGERYSEFTLEWILAQKVYDKYLKLEAQH
jgi:8-oxo-dGTP diphosphatase